MSSNISVSVSKGCFAYKGKSRKAKYIDYLHLEDDKYVKNRMKLYDNLWDDLQVHIDILRADLNSQIFEDLITFTSTCHKDRYTLNGRFIGEIPTAVLITGVNTPDHGVMFSNLNSMFKARVTPLVARIMSKDCSRVSMLVASVVQQLTDITVSLDDDELCAEAAGLENESILENTPVKLKKNIRHKKAVNMSTLVKWYGKTYSDSAVSTLAQIREKTTSPCKKKCGNSEVKTKVVENESSKKKPLVILMLEDSENISSNVLQDFILLCSSYLSSLPIVLVLGIATAVTAIHQLLPTSVSSLLCMEKFHAPPASRYLTQLMDKIIMTSDLPFKLGPKVFHFLLDIFLYHDFSITNFIAGFKYSMTEHFLSNPLSLLCCYETDIANTVSRLTHSQLEDLRRHSAFMKYVEGTPGHEQIKLITDDNVTKIKISEQLQAMHDLHTRKFPSMRFLHCLGLNLPKHPLGKQIRELYSTCLSESVCESEGYKQTFNFLRIMCCDDLHDVLGLCLNTISEVKISEVRNLYNDVEKFRYRLKHLDEEMEDSEHENIQSEVRILPQRAKLHELKEKLQLISSSRKKSPYECLRDEILNSLDNHFRNLLQCPMTHPLHEIFYFNDVSAIRDHIKAAPRCSIQHALSQPGKYLSCSCCQCDAESILPSMPDVCIVYKLHLECGTLVNLYDWLQAFVVVISSKGTDMKKPTKASKTPSLEHRARFIRAVAELQFLGFVKATQRKTDHVTRLTW
ncbi:origin recognition complex subunit 3-like [Physella acuta]|uniref:origin recognition complex subunit 3-like n=1 Tax=Physella acuta TaxID=109671 RepID=UPI0027DC1CFE|nr:origin recognition complex subunit 3-like [Physella acuta]